MHLGVAGELIPSDPDAVDDRVAARIAELGFTGVTVHFGAAGGLEPEALDADRCRRVRETLGTHGIRIVQSWAFGANLVQPGEAERARQVERVGRAMRVAADLGADAVIGNAGSVNPSGRYAPHPENHSAETRARLVRSLREAASLGEEHGVPLALEPHVLTALDTPERVREILDEVASPFVRVNLDPVNFVGDLQSLYGSTALVERMFAELGDLAVSGHAKDVYVEDGFVLHLSETIPGDGELDLATYLRRFEERLPEAFMFVEHLPANLVPRAKARLDELLAEIAA